MKKTLHLLLISAVFSLILAFKTGNVFAASFLFDPTTASVAAGSAFTVKVNVDTGGEDTNGAAPVVIYDPNLIEVTSAANGGFYNNFIPNTSTSGKIVIGANTDVGFPKKGVGTVATLTLKAKTNGTARLSFDCTGPDNPGIFKADLNATNIMTCSSNNTSTITIGDGGTNPTATPAGGSGGSGGTTPTVLPQTGIADTMLKFGIPGAILVIIGIGLRLL
jgi:hypothetical protein